jgi:hypothetical protein
MSELIGYKVVFVRKDGRYESCCRNKYTLHPLQRLKYAIGQTTVPKNQWGPLALFPSFDDAKGWVRTFTSGKFALLRVSYVLSERKVTYNFRYSRYGNGTPGQAFAEAITPLQLEGIYNGKKDTFTLTKES